MADIKKAMKEMLRLEFNDPKNALHWNKGETGWTYMGVYQKAHPEWTGWKIVDEVLKETKSTAEASEKLYANEKLTEMVSDVYKKNYWDKMRLDEVVSQVIAEEMFVFGVNAGCKVAVRAAQRVVGVKDDGVIGPMTLKALNSYRYVEDFDREYDLQEVAHYEMLAEKNPNFERFLKGWKNRAVAV